MRANHANGVIGKINKRVASEACPGIEKSLINDGEYRKRYPDLIGVDPRFPSDECSRGRRVSSQPAFSESGFLVKRTSNRLVYLLISPQVSTFCSSIYVMSEEVTPVTQKEIMPESRERAE